MRRGSIYNAFSIIFPIPSTASVGIETSVQIAKKYLLWTFWIQVPSRKDSTIYKKNSNLDILITKHYLVRDVNSQIYFYQIMNIFLAKVCFMIIFMMLWNSFWSPLKI
jgi:hypothetical protein